MKWLVQPWYDEGAPDYPDQPGVPFEVEALNEDEAIAKARTKGEAAYVWYFTAEPLRGET